jgi:hypothetical protein
MMPLKIPSKFAILLVHYPFSIAVDDNQAGDVITMSNNIASALPGAVVSTSGTNPISLDVIWAVPATPLSNYSFNLFMEDDACPIKGTGSEGYLVNIVDLDLSISPTSSTYCVGDPVGVQLNTRILHNGVVLTTGTATSTGCTAFSQVETITPSASSNTINFTGVPTTATGNATVIVSAMGDLDGLLGSSNEEFWTILGDDGTTLTTLGGSGDFTDQCSRTIRDTVTVSNAVLLNWIADGNITFTANDLAGNVSTTLCTGAFITVDVEYCESTVASSGGTSGGSSTACTPFNQNQNTTPASSSHTISFTGLPAGATGDATITFTAMGDLDGAMGGSNEEMWTILGDDGTVLTTIGGSGNSADQCSAILTVTATVPNATLAGWIADGNITFTANDVAGNINTSLCSGSFLAVDISYCGLSSPGNGTGTGTPTGMTFAWTPTSNMANSTIMSPTVMPASTMTYQLTVDYKGCSVVRATTITCALLEQDCAAFQAKSTTDKVDLTWTVENEENVVNYTVQRATDNGLFEPVGTVDAQNNGGQQVYSFVDTEGLTHNANYYYKLVSHEQDGQEAFICNTVSAQLKGTSVTQLRVFPNPTKSTLNLALETQDSEQFILEVYSMFGQKIAMMASWDLSPGLNTKTLNLDNLTTGVYVLTIMNPATGATQVRKIIKE